MPGVRAAACSPSAAPDLPGRLQMAAGEGRL
jgi:hypothetical protein